MARYGIVGKKAYGVQVGACRKLAKEIGRDHELAVALWDTGWYEARLMTAFLGDPAEVTVKEADHWARTCENWADCDTICFALLDRSRHALALITKWSKAKGEFHKRCAFALLASAALHDKGSPDAPYAKTLALIAREAHDERNFVKKGIVWALRGVAGRSPALKKQAIALATRLSKSADSTERWVGLTTLRELKKTR